MAMRYIDEISEDDADLLIEEMDGPCVSIYLQTHPVTTKTDKDVITLKNLLSEARKQLVEQDVKRHDAEAMLLPFDSLLTDRPFLSHLSEGLALFASPNTHLSYRLPHRFDERLQVGSRFYLKPLLPLLSEDGEFFVLSLSANEVRLFEGTRYSVQELTADELPKSMIQAFKSNEIPGGEPTKNPTGGEGQKKAYLQYFHYSNQAMREFLNGRQCPLVLAGVDYLLPIYSEANSYKGLVKEGITGSPEQLTPQQLHEKAWPIAEPLFFEPRKSAEAEFHKLQGTGKTSTSVEEVVLASLSGKVKSLFVNLDSQRFGKLDQERFSVELHDSAAEGDYDLLDKAAVLAYRTGGKVFGCSPDQMPQAGDIAATLRA